MSGREFRRPVKPRALPAEPLVVTASEAEAAALAARIGVDAVEGLRAEIALERDGEAVLATGVLTATLTQPCAVTGEPLSYAIAEPLALRFVPESGRAAVPDEEIELADEDLDTIEYGGDAFDLGEALAQSLALAVDPYREGPGADAMRAAAGIVSDEDAPPTGPLAEALAALKAKGG